MINYSNNVAAIILAGGQSKRMGKPKALLKIGTETMLQRIVRLLLGCVNSVVVVGAPDHDDIQFADNRIRWARDSVSGEGPLRGLEAGLVAIPNAVEKVFVAGCDGPFLQAPFITYLLSHSEEAQAWVPEIDGILQPIPAVYRVDVLPKLTEMLADGQRSLKGFLREIQTCIVPEATIRETDPRLLSFENMNTPSDYQRILKVFGHAT